MSIYGNVRSGKKSSRTTRRPKLPPGKYLVEILKHIDFVGAVEEIPFYLVEMEVKKIYECAARDEEGECAVKPGQVYGWMQDLNNVWKAGNVKAFLELFIGPCPDDEAGAEEWERAAEDLNSIENQALVGEEVVVDVFVRISKTGQEYKRYDFRLPE